MSDDANATLRLRRSLFAGCPSRRLAPGEVLLREGEPNRHLYLVESGSLRGSCRQPDGSEREVLLARTDDLVGIQSAVLRRPASQWTISAVEPATVIGRELADGELERLADQLLPLLVGSLVGRQQQALQQVEVEKLAVLGQMAAGVAHELNNALAVIGRGSDRIGQLVAGLMAHQQGHLATIFDRGYRQGRRTIPADRLRATSATLRSELGLDFATARRLAQVDLDAESRTLLHRHPRQVEAILEAWELGATLHDLQVAARQSGHVVVSMKQLGARERLRQEPVSLDESLDVASSILGSVLRGIAIDRQGPHGIRVPGNQGELVQIWTNLMKNAVEAMQRAGTPDPRLCISVTADAARVAVGIADNGPGIDPAVRARLYEPDMTTKKSGLSFGLGLGLSIVRRLVLAHAGDIACQSDANGTTFTIRLPRLAQSGDS